MEKLSGRREMGPKLGLRSRVKLGEAEVRRRASEGTTQSFRAGCRGRGRLDMLITRAVHACQVAQSFLTLCDPMDCSPPGSCPWDSPGKNTGVGCHALLQGIFPTRGSNLHLLHCRQILYQLLSHQGNSVHTFCLISLLLGMCIL